MEMQPMEKIDLSNGLSLEIYDLSRPLPGDRWYLELKVSIPIAVDTGWFGAKFTAPADIDAMRKALGDQVVFEHRTTRHYIGAEEKSSVLSQMHENLKSNFHKYYSHPDFAAGYLLKLYQKYLSLPPGRKI